MQIERSGAADWLMKGRFPKLNHLSYTGLGFPGVNKFLDLHPTINTLNLCNATLRNLRFDEMAESASQVVSLTMPAEWTHHLIRESIFPSLRTLVIVDYPVMPVARFNSFLKARCLPLSHPESSAKSPSLVIDALFIDFHKEELRTRRLSESVLYAEATKQVQPEDDSRRIRIKLLWPTC